MKSFYVQTPQTLTASQTVVVDDPHITTRARIAIYDGPASAPRVEEIGPCSVDLYIESLSAKVYELARAQGGSIPYTVVREVVENFIHAEFAEPVVSILDDGKTLRFADQGPGISDKERAVMPGFTTASNEMKNFIRGVGSGLPIVSDYLAVSGGSLDIQDNLGRGSVVTISCVPREEKVTEPTPSLRTTPFTAYRPTPSPRTLSQESPSTLSFDTPVSESPVAQPRLSTRQKQVLALVMETGTAGPSLVSRELGVGVSTAYRDLASLEELGLISAVDGGKRHLTEKGISFLDELMTGA